MTVRLSLAAAVLAVAGVACSDAPNNSRTSQAARPAPLARKLGQYTMTISPAGAGGRHARVEIVPDLRDGNPNTNPPGSVQVYGTFAAVVDSGATSPCGVRSINLPLKVTNFAADPLANVQVQITGMSRTGFEVCSPTTGNPALLPGAAGTSPGAVYGLVPFGTLGGSPVNTGLQPGLSGTVQIWFKYPSNTPVSFSFAVWADPRQPELASVGDLTIGTPLTWASAGSATTQVELCAVDPGPAGTCPAGSRTTAAVTGTGAGPWSFSYIPAATDGATIFWRAANTYAGVLGNFASPWDSFTAVAPFTPPAPVITGPAPVGVPPGITPATFPADVINPAVPVPIDVTWTSAPTVTMTHIQVCDTVDCLPAAPAVGLLDEAWEAGAPVGAPTVTSYEYLFDASLSLPLDPLSGGQLLAPGVYYVNVYNWDDLAGADVGAPAISAFEIVPVGAGAVPPPQIVGPVGPEVDPLVFRQEFPANLTATVPPGQILLQWTTDPSILDSQYELCDTPDCAPAAGKLGSLTGVPVPVVGFVPAVGQPTEFSVDAVPDLPLDPATGSAWLTPGIYYFFVTNLDGAGAPIGATVASSFLVTSSMPAAPGQLLPADGTSFSQQSYVFSTLRQVAPIALQWSSPPDVTETLLEISYTPDFQTPFVIPVAMGGTAGGLNTYGYDLVGNALGPDLVDDSALLPAGSGGTYLLPGLVYWRVYDVDPLSGNFLVPPGGAVVKNIDIATFNPAWAVSVPATAPFKVTITGAPTLANAYVQLCDTPDCLPAGAAAGAIVGAEGPATPLVGQPGKFELDLATLGVSGSVYFRVVDDEAAALQIGGSPPAGMWFVPNPATTDNYPVPLP